MALPLMRRKYPRLNSFKNLSFGFFHSLWVNNPISNLIAVANKSIAPNYEWLRRWNRPAASGYV